MKEAIQSYPLQWPAGWRRTESYRRTRAAFGKKEKVYRDVVENGLARRIHAYDRTADLSIFDAIERVLGELGRMGISRDDIVISSNVPTRIDGLPKSNARVPDDPGVAVYWRKGKETRCMAVDRYDRVADNLAAISATLDAMRAIERHGGAMILDRVFQGFTSLPSPESWWQVLGLHGPDASRDEIDRAHRKLAMQHHPDRGGDNEMMSRINRARDQGLEAT